MTGASVRTTAHRVGVLGPIVVESPSGEAVEPGGATAKALIAALVLARGPLSVRGIVDDLWQDNPPRNEKAALQTLVSRVRATAADGLIVSTPGGYSLGIATDHTDLGAATAERDAARAALERGDSQGADARASAGLALWRGEAGVDLGESELAERLGSAAAELRSSLTVLRAHARVTTGDTFGALSDLGPLIEASPLDEDLELLRLRAIAAGGRRNDAIREFGEFRERMRDELGTDPSADLVAFNAELLRAPDVDAPPSRTVRIGLRTAPNELVGRERDLDAVEAIMRASRLTTILGAGGLGKTRLAQELAARATERMPGVVVVELASVRAGDDVPLALASTLGIREYTGTRLSLSDPAVRVDVRGRILAALSERPTLLVMDNCEHLIDAAAEWIADILASTVDVRVLATSRSPLMISAEQVYQLEPLASLAGDDTHPGPAVTLFMERARAARPSVVLPVDAIERLCERLDGLPLAIELAAARVRTMSVEEIERRIVNRFVLLRGGDRAAPERHRTLLAVIDWSWNLLTDSEQRTLRRLSPFVDGFGADAAEAVAGADDTEADLEGLVNQSLLTAAESRLTGRVRYRMLETVREFGDQRLHEAGEQDDVAARIRAWADAAGLTALDLTYGPDQLETFHRVEEEQDNLVSAMRDAIAVRDAATAASVYAALGMHWTLRGAHSEVLGFAPAVLDLIGRMEPDERHIDSAMVSLALIGGTSLVSDTYSGIRALVRVRKLRERSTPRHPQLDAMVSVLLTMPDLAAATTTVERLRRSDDPAIASFANLISAQLAENAGEVDEGLRFASVAYTKAELAQDAWTVGTAAQAMAQFHSERGDAAEALEWAERARPNLSALSASEDLRQLDWLKAISEVSLGRLDSARTTFESLTRLQGDAESFDWRDLQAIGYAGLAEIAAKQDDQSESERLYAIAEQVWGDPPGGFAPWYYGAGAGLLVASVRAGHVNDPRNLRVARRIRSRLLRDHRVRAGMIDRPITGIAAIGLAVWLLAPEREGADDAQRVIAMELLALGRGIRARQDFPSLSWRRAADELGNRDELGDRVQPGDGVALDFDTAWAGVEALSLVERTERLHVVIRTLRDAVA
ncbi:BTAD domain-containing putative transcriptional regulator [Humibacter soli]